jgi:hypothetical protein
MLPRLETVHRHGTVLPQAAKPGGPMRVPDVAITY